jgi:hypothetical protein
MIKYSILTMLLKYNKIRSNFNDSKYVNLNIFTKKVVKLF